MALRLPPLSGLRLFEAAARCGSFSAPPKNSISRRAHSATASIPFGVAVHMAAVHIPGDDLIVATSVLVAGLGVFIVAGFFHGYSYGASIYGAEPAPLAAYLTGLTAVQTLLTVGVASLTRGLWKLWSTAPRLAGAAISGVGFTALLARLIPLH